MNLREVLEGTTTSHHSALEEPEKEKGEEGKEDTEEKRRGKVRDGERERARETLEKDFY